MITAEQLPDDAVAAAEYEACREDRPNIRKVIAAAINAWPGMEYDPGALVTDAYRDPGKIILPLALGDTHE